MGFKNQSIKKYMGIEQETSNSILKINLKFDNRIFGFIVEQVTPAKLGDGPGFLV